MIGVIIDTDDYIKSFYTFDIMLSTLGVPYNIINVKDQEKNIVNYDENLLIIYYGNNLLKEPKNSQKSIHKLDKFLSTGGCVIHIPFNTAIEENIDKYLKEGYKINTISHGQGWLISIGVDIIYSSFFFISRLEEKDCKEKDRHSRFIEKFSLSYKFDLLERPIVNEYFELLNELIIQGHKKRQIPLLQKMPWPGGKEFAVSITHDVDEIKKFTLKRAIMELLNYQVKDAFKSLYKSLGKLEKDPYWTFFDIIALEKKYRIKSSFYFGGFDKVSRKSHHKAPRGLEIAYNIDDKIIKDTLKQIHDFGWEIGIHGSYVSHDNLKYLGEEKVALERIINAPVTGIRQHFLRFNINTTWRSQKALGFVYDTTLGYSDIIGFRAGICIPYNGFDHDKNQPISIKELPMIIMDGALTKYSYNEVVKILSKYIEIVKRHHGVLTILWHTTFADSSVIKKTYNWLLQRLNKENAFISSARDLINWWEKRDLVKFDKMKLSQIKNSKKIVWQIQAGSTIENLVLNLKLHTSKEKKFKISVNNVKKYRLKKINDFNNYIIIDHINNGDTFTIRYEANY